MNKQEAIEKALSLGKEWQWLAQNMDGAWWTYSEEPITRSISWALGPFSPGTGIAICEKQRINYDWKNTLVDLDAIRTKIKDDAFAEIHKASQNERRHPIVVGFKMNPILSTRADVHQSQDRLKYRFKPRTYEDGTMDCYQLTRSLEAHQGEGIDPAIEHAVKKLLFSGKRGVKDKLKDWQEAKLSIEMAIEALQNFNDPNQQPKEPTMATAKTTEAKKPATKATKKAVKKPAKKASKNVSKAK